MLEGYVGGIGGTMVASASYALTTSAFIHAAGFATPIDLLVIKSDPSSVAGRSYLMDDFSWEWVAEPATIALLGLGLAGFGTRRRRAD